jgi:hypothetical protein
VLNLSALESLDSRSDSNAYVPDPAGASRHMARCVDRQCAARKEPPN